MRVSGIEWEVSAATEAIIQRRQDAMRQNSGRLPRHKKREFDKELAEATKNDAQAWLDARVGTLKEASANPAEFHRVWKQLVVRGRKLASGRGRYFSSKT